MLVFEIETVEFEHHPDFKILELRWIKVIEPHSWEILVPKLIEVGNSYQIESIIFDASYAEIQPSIQVVQQLPLSTYIKRLSAILSLKKIARVASGSSTYDQLVQDQYTSGMPANPGIEFKNFEHRYAAIDWVTGKAKLS
ncbi:hypothetical protein HUW51_19550 [Adhaeribacter swui]|uniref:STAS/SEC14 domain-containing protein n=1 Tax=Adhaeribacter swui TaxID=2086471 RepID=A0A7G7GCD2_9BACT|nr:hypothetical protein [Adhaeribacter swui]QNF34816.1 hypothetical protein HUW51_19550 [Adhaeribacter swui]